MQVKQKIARFIIDAIQWMIANVRFGSLADPMVNISLMTAAGGKADLHVGRF